MAELIKVYVRALSQDGYWRANLYWPHDGLETEVSPEVLAELEAERNLSVVRGGRGEEQTAELEQAQAKIQALEIRNTELEAKIADFEAKKK